MADERDADERDAHERDAHERDTVLFVHGFGSSAACWTPLLTLLRGDDAITSRYDLRTWEYPTKWIELNILGRIPGIKELGRSLGDEIDSPAYRGRPLTLVGHSQGGLVIMSWMEALLNRGQAAALDQVRQAIFFATPSEGSTTGMSFRALAAKLFTNPQEITLRVLNPDVAELRATVRERIVTATRDTDNARRVPIHAFSGLQDNVVPEASARGPFESVRRVPGDHFSILKPPDRRDRRYAELAELLLDPGGHGHRFEVARYECVIRVEPRPKQTILRASRNGGLVEYDNVATLRRTVRFAPSNRSRDPFTIKYGTRKEGYIVGHPSHRNEAPAAEIGRGEDTGTFYQFDFTPAGSDQDYCLNVEVYKGFDPGDRDVHFHLGDHSHYRQLVYVLDLSAYMAAGYRVSEGPKFYLNPEDMPHTDMCRSRGARAPMPATSTPAPGVFRWEVSGVRKGVVDIVWDVEGAPAGVPPTGLPAGLHVEGV